MKRSLFSFILTLILTFGAISTHAYVCGDINNDPQQKVTVADIIYLVQHLFGSGVPIPGPNGKSDLNCSGSTTVADLTRLVAFCFNNGPSPCADCIATTDQPGDVNLNEIAYEISDAVLFGRSFLYGVDSMFHVHLTKQVAATEVNGDGIPLAVADFAYVWGVLTSSFPPEPISPPPILTTTYAVINGVVSIDSAVAAAFIVVEGNVAPSLLATNMWIQSYFNGEHTNIIIASPGDSGDVETFSGPFLNIGFHPILSTEFASPLGGVVIAECSVCSPCDDPIDARGDMNLNDIANEIADALHFANYFVFGLSAFTVNEQEQICASDVNADGVQLGVADLVYLWGVVIGAFNPFPSPPVASLPLTMDATYTITDGEIAIDSTVAGAFIIVEGDVTPTLLATHMGFSYNFDGSNTRILVWSMAPGEIETFSGAFVDVGSHNVISAEFGTALGGVVNATRVDGK